MTASLSAVKFTQEEVAAFPEDVVVVVVQHQRRGFEVPPAQFQLRDLAPSVLSAGLKDSPVQEEKALACDTGQKYLT